MIEPIAGVYAAPNGGNQRKIPDEDSLSFDYDDSLLFRPDRLAGYDVLDTGQRVDYGLKLGLYDNNGGSYRALDRPELSRRGQPLSAARVGRVQSACPMLSAGLCCSPVRISI